MFDVSGDGVLLRILLRRLFWTQLPAMSIRSSDMMIVLTVQDISCELMRSEYGSV